MVQIAAAREPRRGGVERLGHAGHVADRVEQDLGPQPLAVVAGEVAGVGDVPLVGLGAQAVDATRP